MAENFKGELIAALGAQGQTPRFQVAESGPPHARTFRAEVWCSDQLLGQGVGGSKREAAREAARAALAELRGEDFPVSQSAAAPGAAVWPLHPAVLAEALAVADSRLPAGTPLPEVAARAGALYRELLQELGHGPQPPAEQA